MPIPNPYCCDTNVKHITSNYSHKRCSQKINKNLSSKVTGQYINQWLVYCREVNDSSSADVLLNPNQHYSICYNLNKMIKKSKSSIIELVTKELIEMEQTSNTTTKSNSDHDTINNVVLDPYKTSDTCDSMNMSRGTRLKVRNGTLIVDPLLPGIKEVKVVIDGEQDQVIDIRKKRICGNNTKYFNDIISNYYKVPFGKLTMRQRRMRMNEIAKILLSACVDRSEYKSKKDNYIKGNTELGVDLLNLMDGTREALALKLKIDFNTIEDQAIVPIPNDTEGLIEELNIKNKQHQLAIALLGETSRNGYYRLRSKIKDFTGLPSYNKLVMSRPNISSISFDLLRREGEGEETTPAIIDTGNEELDLTLALRMTSQNANSNQIHGAKIDGSYSDYIKLMKTKHQRKGRKVEDNNQAIVLDSFDGAEHLKSKKEITSVISFSSVLFTPRWIIEKAVLAASSLNMLTWQQLRGHESLSTMMPAVKEYFTCKSHLYTHDNEPNTTKFWYYDIHDGKMLYLLTQHSQWSRKFHPFLLCKCKRGEGVRNTAHNCQLLSHQEQVQMWDRSLRRWKNKKELEENGGSLYTPALHGDWVDKNNLGVSHLGLHPNLLPRDHIRMDVFHLKCSVTRKLMSYLRNIILDCSSTVREQFEKTVLRSIWKDFHIYVWNNKKNFSSFQGNELALFVSSTDIIVQWIDLNMESIPLIEDLKDALNLWKQLFKFLGTTYIVEGGGEEYCNRLDKFNDDVTCFYEKGRRTFLSEPGNPGGTETFYMHALRFYLPRFARQTYQRHGLGIGIFNMQGFERRNKESKNCMKRFCNHRGNVLVNNMKRIYDVFEHDLNAY